MRGTRISALVVTATVMVATAACGSSTPSSTPTGSPTGSSTTAAPTTTATTVPLATIATPTAAGTFGTAPPKVTVPSGAPPTVLESSDLITGTGAVARTGDTLTVQYVLVGYATGMQIQSSWSSMPFSFTLGGQVIPGWNEGVVGMKVGGRRELIIPPALGYGAEAQQGIPANSTLVFIIDLLKIG